MKRRSFLKLALSLPLAARAGAFPSRLSAAPADVRSGEGPYSGDEFRQAHQFLRDGLQVPAPTGQPSPVRDVLVIGGGMSGLMTAWMLKDLDVAVLEKDRLPGGTSKSESWNGIPYSIGAAYVGLPERGSPLARFYREMGVDREWRVFGDKDMGIYRKGELEVAYWERPDRKTVAAAFTAMLEHRYADLPFSANEAWTREEMAEIDTLSWSQLLEKGLPVRRGEPPVKIPAVEQEFCKLFAPAVLAARPDECSAWAMLNQFLAEFGRLAALPGGNGAIARRLVQKLDAHAGARVRTGAMAVAIENIEGGVRVTTRGEDGQTTVHSARAAVFAGPKFVAARIVRDLPPEQMEAIMQILYRPFLVANVCLTKPAMDRALYDAYTLGLEGSELGDLTLADWAARVTGNNSVITCYIPLARDDARAELLDDTRLPQQKERLIADLLAVLGPRGLKRDDIADVRFARWGHPMVVPKPGQLSSGLFERAAKPHGKVFFAHQDNFGNPCIESCFAAATEASKRVRAALPKKASKKRR